MVDIVVATHNEGKLAELEEILLAESKGAWHLVSAGSLGLPDPVETGVTFEQNALLKARFVAQLTGLPTLADDSGLVVDVMGAAPGVLSARWSGKHGDDAAKWLLLAQMSDIPDAHRGARFTCAAAAVIPDAHTEAHETLFETVQLGHMAGKLLRAPRGEHGFGYDPIFAPDEQPSAESLSDEQLAIVRRGEQLSSAELTSAQKNAISHRGKAFHALMPILFTALRDYSALSASI